MNSSDKGIEQQLSTRINDRIESCLSTYKKGQRPTHLFLTSSSDTGVYRNGGRRGTQFAPEAIINTFKKLSKLSHIEAISYSEVSTPVTEQVDFHKAQNAEAQKIADILQSNSAQTVHIGGGHDHVYPMIKALREVYSKKHIHIINIDAHLDTRVDKLSHSGTPFRQLINEDKNLTLYQVGIHRYANSQSNYNDLNQQMKVLHKYQISENLEQLTLQLDSFLPKADSNDIWVLSIDIDAIDSSVMEAVSAVNHNGLMINQIKSIMSAVKQRSVTPYLGIYEYNPLYDNLSQKGSRAIADLLVTWFE